MNETSQLTKTEVHLPILFITPCNVAHTSGSPFPHAFEDPRECTTSTYIQPVTNYLCLFGVTPHELIYFIL